MRRIAPLLGLIGGAGCAGTYVIGDEQAVGAAAGTPGTGAAPGLGLAEPSGAGASGPFSGAAGDTGGGIESLSTGFERGQADTAGWSMFSDDGYSFELSPISATQDRAHAGQWSASGTPEGNLGPARLLTPFFETDTSYQASIWVKLDGQEGNLDLRLIFRCVDGSAGHLWLDWATVGSSSWVELKGYPYISSGRCEQLAAVYIYVTGFHVSVIHVDDFEIAAH